MLLSRMPNCPGAKSNIFLLQVKLGPLPQSFSRILQQYNQHVGTVFDYYLESVSKHVDKQNGGHDSALPLSGLGNFT